MLMRIGALLVLLAAGVIACTGGQPGATPEPVREASSVAAGEGTAVLDGEPDGGEPAPEPLAKAPRVAAGEGSAALGGQPDGGEPAPEPVRDIPPCTPIEGASVDPCAGDGPLAVAEGDGGSVVPGEPFSVRFFVDGGPSTILTNHLVIRGTYKPNTVRCIADDTTNYPAYLGWAYDHSRPGGVTEVKCFSDVRVNAYLLGSGPSTLTVMVAVFDVWSAEPPHESEEVRAYFESALLEGGVAGFMTVREGGISGVEQVMFLFPSFDVSVETWTTLLPRNWDIKTKDDGTVMAVHPHRDHYARYRTPTEFETLRPKLEMTLTALKTAITTADQARRTEHGGRIGPETTHPTLVSSANDLDDYFRQTAVGAYIDPPRTPIQPPPSCGLVVSDQADNSGLMVDCLALLTGKDTLRGTGTLNWDTGTAMTSWDGVTVSGTPKRVTKLELPSESLTGSLPAALGRGAVKLTHVDLSGNSLTGRIPAELKALTNLVSLKLTGNTLTGCIPLALKDVASHDLDSLGLLYCRPPAPGGLAGTPTETTMALTWNTVSNTSKYRLEHRPQGTGDWTLASDTLTTTTHTVSRLECGSPHQFRVSAYGSGTVYAAAWSEPSVVYETTTGECVTPAFGQEAYDFQLSYKANVGDAVGTVLATDPNDDTVAHTIAAGNDDNKFSINGDTGDITLAEAPDVGPDVVRSYTLTVQASDGSNTGTVTVEVAILHPTVSLTAVPETIVERDVADGTVRADHLDPSASYRIRVQASGSSIAFHRTRCSFGDFTVDVASGLPSFVRFLPVHACDTPGGTLTATLTEGSTTLDTFTQAVAVTEPTTPRLPSIEILGPDAAVEEGGDTDFRVRAFYLTLAENYEVRVTTDSANLGFDSACTDRQRDASIALGEASAIVSLDLYGCTAPGGTVTATLLQYDDTTAATDTWDVTVSEPPPGPSVEIAGLAADMAEGWTDEFEVTLSHLSTNASYFLEVSTDGANLGFDSACADRLKEPSVPRDEATHTASLTLHACTAPGGTVTATLSGARGDLDTATWDVTVVVPPTDLPPAPTGIAVSLGEDGFSITWDEATGVEEYEVQYRTGGEEGTWFSAGTATTPSLAFNPEGGLACGTTYDFRVRAYGDGLSYVADWGGESGEESVETEACNQPPVFDHDSYSFTVAEDADQGAEVDTVSATDPDTDDTVTYGITSGNGDGKFDIGESTGTITVAAELDHETDDSYRLTVEADDGREGTDTARVDIAVSDVAEDLVAAPTGLSASLADGSFSISWDEVTGADRYDVQYRTGGAEGAWTSIEETAGTSSSFNPDGGPACETTYDFRVRAYGDGTTYVADWGEASDPEPVTTGACNQPPEFTDSSYTFIVSQDASVGRRVGGVSAADTDQGDTVTYSITAGNESEKFAIDSGTGSITVKDSLSDAAGTLYTLTVQAEDGVNTVTVTVSIQVSAMCSTGIAVPDPADNPGLVGDCLVLLMVKDTLIGTGTRTLDWAAHTAMTGWEGVTVSGTPQRVTELDVNGGVSDDLTGSIPPELANLTALESLDLSFNVLTGSIPIRLTELSNLRYLDLNGNGLTGTIPPGLGGLSELTGLWLQNNSLSGGIPTELGGLSDLEGLGLSGNQLRGSIPPELGNLAELLQLWLRNNHLGGTIPGELTLLSNLWLLHLEDNDLVGCIPPALHDIRNNDLQRLGLSDCAEDLVAAPTGLTASLEEGTFSLSWSAVTGAGRYEAQHRGGGPGTEWIPLPATTATSTTYTPQGGVTCGVTYEFRVRAHGDGFSHMTLPGPASSAVSVTEACNQAPVFGDDTYSFSVAEDASPGHRVGGVSATDPDAGDTVTYSITAGNGDGKFDIGESTGDITVAAALDHEDTGSYRLTVQAGDGREGTDTATVDITVTDVAEDPPPAPTGLSASLSAGTFSLSWDAVTGAAKYEAQYRTGGDDGAWTTIGETTGTTSSLTPTGGPACGTTYDFRVLAYGDGETYAEEWGEASGTDSVTAEACNQAPAFDDDTYSFTVGEDAPRFHVLGAVSATDPDDDQVYYTITRGNGERRIGINPSSGTLSLLQALDYETTRSYTLTVAARDPDRATDTATVTITVTDVAEDPPPAPTGLSVFLSAGTFSLSWDAVTGAARYEAQYRTRGTGSPWTTVEETTGTTSSFAPSGGPACGTTYGFRVLAYGDGDTYAAEWGDASGTDSVTTGSCNRPPAFGSSDYTFTISDGASPGDSVGSVSATDPDSGDSVSYSITGGNEDDKFAVGESTGAVTVKGALDYAATAAYTLTVQASDGNGGTDTATVTVSLTLAACSNGTVVPRAAQNPRLVRDCSVLLTAKDTLAGDGALNWSADLAIRSWDGVTLEFTPSMFIRDLGLTDEGLTGTIPASFGRLKDLRRLELDENDLTGSVPAELGDMTNLDQLYLQGNQLTGVLPEELSQLRYLSYLHLQENRLTGSIPAKFGELDGLSELLLDDNRLSGAVPPEVGDMEDLEVLFLRYNEFSGAIPAALEDLDNLSQLYLEGNSWTGCIPADLEEVEYNDLDLLGLDYCSS